jgi:hypothetical protein
MMKAFKEIFEGLNSAYGQYIPSTVHSSNGKQKGRPFTVKKPVVDVLWENHLKGKEPALGIIPINEKSLCRWGCIDIDQYDFNHKKFIKKIKQKRLPLVVCRSKSGGAHVFLFVSEWIEAAAMRAKLKIMAAALGYSECEIFPKQEYILIERGDTGSFLNLPYHGGDNTTRYAFKDNGDAANLKEFLELHSKYKLTKEKFENLIIESEKEQNIKDGPPCLQTLCKEGFPEGTRNNGLYNIGVYLKKANPDTWQTDLATYNTKFMKPPLSPQQVMTTISSLNKKDYQYKCKDQPICNYCDSLTCQTRKFGIGNGTLMPDISNLRKFTSDPPRWFVNVGGETVDVKTNELRTFDLFDEACMDQISIKLPNVSKPIWGKVISNLMKAVEEIEAPETLKYKKQLEEHLENFTTDRAAGKQKTDINRGVSWTDEGITYFKFKDFWKYLQNTRSWDMERNKTLTKIGEYFDANIKDQISIVGKDVKVVSLKAFTTQKEKDEPPKVERPPFVK